MPPKKRPKGVLPGAKLGRPFGRKPSCREAEVQTDAEFGILLESVSALSAGESSVGDRGKGDSAVLLRRQNILMMQLRKISKQNREMRTVIAKYEQIPNLLQAIKVHYESTFNSIKDDIAMLVFEQQNRGTKLMDHMQKQKCSIERLIAAKDEKLKAKEEKNNALKDEKKLLNEGLGYLQEALELEQRRVQVAVKEQCNALDEMQEIRLKMEDKLFLAANQRCSTCQTRERVQDELTDQIAGKLHQIEEFRKLLLMKDDAIAEKDRINELLISDLVKKRGECNDKTFAAKSYQSELANQLRKLKQAQIEIQQLRTMVPSSNCTSHEQQPNPHILTPPEEENGPPFVPLPCVAKVTMPTNGRSEQQQQISKKNEQNTMGKVSMNQNIEGRNGQNAKPKRNSREEELSLSVFVGKRPRVVSTANHGNGPVGLDNGGDGTVSAKGGQDNATTGGVNLSTAGGKEPNDRRKGEEVTERFFSPPPLKRKNSNNVLPAPPPPQIQQQQQMTARLTTTAPENIGQFQQRKKTEQQQGGGIVSKSWRPMDQQLPAPQKPQQSFAASQIQHPQQHQQLQQQLLRNSLPPVGPTTSPKLTTPTSHQSFFFSSANNNNIIFSNNSSSFRKYGGATIDDFCGGPKATSFNNNSNGRTALPVSGGGAELVSGTWRKSVPGSSFINRPTDTHPNAFINHQMRERIEQNICGAIASCAGASNPTTASVAAALPPMYACQQQKIPPPRPSAPIPRPPVRPFARQPTINSVNQFAAQTLTHQQQNGGGTARGISSLPWHSHSSGTFPCTTSQQSQHYSTSQFFIR